MPLLQIVISETEFFQLVAGAALVYEIDGIAVDISLAESLTQFPRPPDPPEVREERPK
jgi:hypothetical protein